MSRATSDMRQAEPRICGSRATFRSEGETQIGRCLERHGIDYFYEHPLAVYDRGKLRIWYPDFQIRPAALVIEYGGRLDDPCYAEGWSHKHAVYAANGIDALMLTPRDLTGDWPRQLLDGIEDRLARRLNDFQADRRGGSRHTHAAR